jgi:hypothetical protein
VVLGLAPQYIITRSIHNVFECHSTLARVSFFWELSVSLFSLANFAHDIRTDMDKRSVSVWTGALRRRSPRHRHCLKPGSLLSPILLMRSRHGYVNGLPSLSEYVAKEISRTCRKVQIMHRLHNGSSRKINWTHWRRLPCLQKLGSNTCSLLEPCCDDLSDLPISCQWEFQGRLAGHR